MADFVFERLPRQLGIDLNLAAEIIVWIDAAEHDLGVGIGRFGAAGTVAGGARHRSHALRADIENAALIDPADRAAAGADINRIHRRQAAGHVPENFPFVRDRRLAAIDDGDVVGGAAGFECNHIFEASKRADIARKSHRAGDRRRMERPGRKLQRLVHANDTAAGRGHQDGAVIAPVGFQTIGQAFQVILEDRRHIGIEHRRAGALEFEHLRQHFVRQRDVDVGQFLAQDFARAQLVHRIHERIHVHHGDRLDAALFDHPCCALYVFLGKRRDDLAVRTDTLAHHQHVAPRHDQFGRIPIELESGNALGAAAAEHIAKALGGDQRGLDAFALENGVGGNRGAVSKRERLLTAYAGARQAIDHAVEEGRRRRGDLADPLLAGLQIDPDHIGERTADIGADHPDALAAHALRSTLTILTPAAAGH